MSNDNIETFRRPATPEEIALNDILAEMLLKAVHARNEAWGKHGYHTLRYWASSEAGLAVLGDVLADEMMTHMAMNTFEDIWNLGMEKDLEP